MEADTLHDLTPAYALDALDAEDARAYEAHLARCQRCRDELAELSEAAGALAYAGGAPVPRPELRARILQQAARERPNVVPLRPRWAYAAAATAAVAASVAVGLGIWAAGLSDRLDAKNEALAQSAAQQGRIANLLARPDATAIPSAQGATTLVVTPTGEAALVVRNLPDPGGDFTYEAWVADGGAPQAAGLFRGGDVVAVALDRPVRKGATVMVTKEPRGGTAAPTTRPFIRVPFGPQS
jgi:anti-sigma factor RsiW